MENGLLILADIDIAGIPFRLQYLYGQKKSELAFGWKREGEQTLGLSQLADSLQRTPMGFGVPGQLAGLGLVLSAISIRYDLVTHAFRLRLEADGYGSFTVAYESRASMGFWEFLLQMQAAFSLASLPVFGSGFGEADRMALEEFSLRIEEGQDKKRRITPGVRLSWSLDGKETVLSLPENRTLSWEGTAVEESGGRRDVSYGEVSTGETGTAGGEEKKPSYLDINKDYGFFRLSRVGFSLGEEEVTLLVDGGIRLSILFLEFMGLYLSVPLAAGKKVSFGLKGLAVSMSKPPLFISGGLVYDREEGRPIYSGEVMIRFRDLGVTALCSYGETAQGTVSLFVFLMLSAELGGPPVFYVTGLAGGFGYGRSIVLPDRVQDVERFPFVAAALGKGDLKKGMTPGEALTAMNKEIRPCADQYFFSVGVRFRSFGLLESFLLCNVEFGERFLLSILGISRLTLPLGSEHPLVSIGLALKAVFAPQEGRISIEGALLENSYVLDKNCKVNGGFACCIWFGSSEHAGDFVVTLGGYPARYRVSHYPEVDRLGISWKMDSHLSLTAEAYFALTPSCVMLGGNLSIVYENGRLKAWFQAWAEFFMQWDPFSYDIGVGIALGASYRWDFFPFYRTFRVELGADLSLWGPPFGGKAHISWFIISFTIHFGKEKPQERDLDWKAFEKAFLPEKVIRIQPAAGLLQEGKGTESSLLDADQMDVEISSQMMCSELALEGARIAGYTGTLGIVPMGVGSLGSRLEVTVRDEEGKPVQGIKASPIHANAPKALWNREKPGNGETDNLLEQVPCGIRLTSIGSAPRGILPEQGSYDVETLCANEKLGPLRFRYVTPDPIPSREYPKERVLEQIEESIGISGGRRKAVLEELSAIFGVWREEELRLDGWERDLERQLVEEPTLAVIGADA